MRCRANEIDDFEKYGREILHPATRRAIIEERDGSVLAQQAITDYTARNHDKPGTRWTGAGFINDSLRENWTEAEMAVIRHRDTTGLEDTVDRLQRMIENCPLLEGVVSYRGTKVEYLDESYVTAEDIIEGVEFKPIPSFSSSSLSLQKAMDYYSRNGGCVLRILHPKGAKAMYVEEVTTTKYEYELINQMKMIMEVVKKEEVDGVPVITVRQII